MGKHPLLRGNRRHLTPKELADVLECSTSNIYKLCEEGKIKFNRPNGSNRIRISRAEAVRLEREYYPTLYEEDGE